MSKIKELRQLCMETRNEDYEDISIHELLHLVYMLSMETAAISYAIRMKTDKLAEDMKGLMIKGKEQK